MKRHIPPKLEQLPPTMSCFHTHVRLANFQAALWTSAGEYSPTKLDPLEFGWEMHQSTLQPVFGLTEDFIAPDEVLDIISCGCNAGCSSGLCSCRRETIACTEYCKCRGGLMCLNPFSRTLDNFEDED